ncbi:MAG TPA: DNA primase [Steroidobacteraceae bacterium]|nr:DNA primase [Steroidobacteraceae bacterium]
MPQSFIDELIARADIVEVIGSRVQLKKAGREYRACCPFHNEKTPSFWVSPEKQFYHCFGCGAHGTVLRFLMEHDRMAFPEAVEELASRLGLEVPHEGGSAPGAPRDSERLYDLMSRVARFYAETLARELRARDYLTRRGLTSETIAQFGIGYAPDSWNAVLKHFGTGEPERRALADLGLIIERDASRTAAMREGDRHYDRFRDRIMFPIRDVRGRVIAFGGRVLDRGEPKYLNSPEMVLFHKGRELYGLHESRRSRTNLERLLVVEGYMDVVRLHQSGIGYAVATLGTATTPEHFRRIFRLVREVVFAFDGDRAGRGAAWRALQHALPEAREGREIRFLFLPEGHDPDTLVGEEGREAFERRLESTLPLSEYLVRELSEQTDLTHADGRARFAESARPLIAKVPEGVYRELLTARVAEVVGLSAERLQALWAGASSTASAAADLATRRAGTQAGGSPASQATAAADRSRVRQSAGRGTLVTQAITCLVSFPAIAGSITAGERACLDEAEEKGIHVLREMLDDLIARPLSFSAQVLERWADRSESKRLAELLLKGEEILGDAQAAALELKAALAKLADQAVEHRLAALEERIRAAGLGGLSAEERQEFQELIGKRAGRKPSRERSTS